MSMSSAAINTFEIQLKALARLLDKAEAHATAKKFDVAVLLNSRLAPDMLPLTGQSSWLVISPGVVRPASPASSRDRSKTRRRRLPS